MKEVSKQIYNKIKEPYIKWAVRYGVSANFITILNHFLTLTFGCYFFSRGTHLYMVAGLCVCLLNGFLDYLDGDVARQNVTNSKLGEWLDSGFDVIIQNAVMGAIAIGCFKMGLPLVWIVLFFIGNTANNFVSFYYNAKFGFDSANGNEVFRYMMNQKKNWLNVFLKGLIDPTDSHIALVIYTLRYWIVLGAVINVMPFCFIVMTVIGNIKWVMMYTIYALYLNGNRGLTIFRALEFIDEEQEGYYELRHCE